LAPDFRSPLGWDYRQSKFVPYRRHRRRRVMMGAVTRWQISEALPVGWQMPGPWTRPASPSATSC
jgi:hypothetical protein